MRQEQCESNKFHGLILYTNMLKVDNLRICSIDLGSLKPFGNSDPNERPIKLLLPESGINVRMYTYV